jgi:cytochrome c-type biogenesis protein CcmE
MKRFYVRWAGLLVGMLILALFGVQRYRNDLKSISPEQLLLQQPIQVVRLLGIVQAGSLVYEPLSHQAAFELAGEKEKIAVRYSGQAPENLRELKTLVVIGRWNPSSRQFEAHEITLVPNYGFVAGAYLAGIIPIGLFLFGMERRVELLYNKIKSAKLYEPEEGRVDQG